MSWAGECFLGCPALWVCPAMRGFLGWSCYCWPWCLVLDVSASSTAPQPPGGDVSCGCRLWPGKFCGRLTSPSSTSLVGPMMIEFNMAVDLNRVAEENPEVKLGGRYTPKDCISPHKVAIIIPFRNRQEHLKYWLYYLHPILQRQQLDYGIYVINQVRSGKMERERACVCVCTQIHE